VLVVDESYLEFVPVPEAATMVGCAADNVVVLRSASKFYGIAATRAGVAWCRDRELLDGLIGDQETWGLSGVDVTVATAALASRDWAAQVRQRLLADSRWLADALRVLPDVRVRANHNVHFQYALSDRPRSVADALAAAGVGVRALGRAHGVRPGAVRVVAPREDERDQVSAAFAAVAEGTSDAAVAITVAS
jgi:histidinol-phosphate/aromatic aminotransferase/cobyric acid decarboxylase-like protein